MDNLKYKCRACGANNLEQTLSLGETPLANSLLLENELTLPEEKYPLDLVFCPNCTLVQITETVPPEKLFREYLYFSSYSDTLLRHAQELAQEITISQHLNNQSLVVEIASNDGYLLQYYKQADVPVLGIEPALNIADVAQNERGIPTITEFFGETLAQQLREKGKQADVIHAHNVLAHVADTNGFIEGIHLLLKDDGIAVIEVPYVKDMIDSSEFDTIYHEHLCYFSLTALDYLMRKHGMLAFDVKRVSIHGGSLRVFVTQANGPYAKARETVKNLLAAEASWGIKEITFYKKFAHQVEQMKTDLRKLLADLKNQGKQIAAYGAAAKGSTLLNYFNIGRETLDFVVDRSPHKQGHYMPGLHIPIYSPQKLLEEKPDYVLLLSWNFSDEILEQQKDYRNTGGHFIIPIPKIRIV